MTCREDDVHPSFLYHISLLDSFLAVAGDYEMCVVLSVHFIQARILSSYIMETTEY